MQTMAIEEVEEVGPALLRRSTDDSDDSTAVRCMNALTSMFNVCRYSPTEEFIKTNADLIDHLVEARDNIYRFFPPESRVDLDIIHDAEDDSATFVALTVRPPVDIERALHMLQQFTDAWGLEANAYERRVCVTIG
jgi:hypothetical protein